MARPKLTKDVIATIERKLVSGCTLEDAATAVGVTRRSLHYWLATGREAVEKADAGKKLTERERTCLDLVETADKARADLKVKLLASVQTSAAKGNAQAAEWMLERLWPEEFAPKSRGVKERPNAGRPIGSASSPDRKARPRPGVLRAVK